MKKIVFLAVAALALNIPTASAWGNKGHKIVAKLAKLNLDKSIVDSVQFYLGDTSFEEASVWMDEVRSDHNYDYMKPMHYVNVEKDKTYVQVSDPNIVNELNIVMNELQTRKGRSKEDIKKDLMILFHLTGDIHMPLHAGYSTDKGGNSVDVEFLGFGSNLHKVWDTNIIEDQKITADDCLIYINGLTGKEKKSIQTLNVIDWMNESRALLGAVYAVTDNKIDQAYIAKNTPVIEKQLSKAGLRLATALNAIFNDKSKPTPQ